jgi:hypothetical protein
MQVPAKAELRQPLFVAVVSDMLGKYVHESNGSAPGFSEFDLAFNLHWIFSACFVTVPEFLSLNLRSWNEFGDWITPA